jgi:hypothetical protein
MPPSRVPARVPTTVAEAPARDEIQSGARPDPRGCRQRASYDASRGYGPGFQSHSRFSVKRIDVVKKGDEWVEGDEWIGKTRREKSPARPPRWRLCAGPPASYGRRPGRPRSRSTSRMGSCRRSGPTRAGRTRRGAGLGGLPGPEPAASPTVQRPRRRRVDSTRPRGVTRPRIYRRRAGAMPGAGARYAFPRRCGSARRRTTTLSVADRPVDQRRRSERSGTAAVRGGELQIPRGTAFPRRIPDAPSGFRLNRLRVVPTGAAHLGSILRAP